MLREINDLPEPVKHAIYCTMPPDWLFSPSVVDWQALVIGGNPVEEIRAVNYGLTPVPVDH